MCRSEALHSAAERGDAFVLRRLLSFGVDPDLRNQIGETALMKATDKRQEAAVRILLSAKANVNARDKSGYTALMRACIGPSRCPQSIVRNLAKAKANVNAVNKYDYTALMLACGEPDMVRTVNTHFRIVRYRASRVYIKAHRNIPRRFYLETGNYPWDIYPRMNSVPHWHRLAGCHCDVVFVRENFRPNRFLTSLEKNAQTTEEPHNQKHAAPRRYIRIHNKLGQRYSKQEKTNSSSGKKKTQKGRRRGTKNPLLFIDSAEDVFPLQVDFSWENEEDSETVSDAPVSDNDECRRLGARSMTRITLSAWFGGS
uniref:Uncharacterized protein n=1 Tax=Chromera velia CCMP2878 TaxID=1169474 RepID=A0A0G4HYZ2_9ALVE|eukprot:Cvel_9611.t1-p1 / transcript=Cvel_9611.t1 / gene=Cvel_9611 / organism=Chromera_velia_CCMP2878 / gene_product=Putative ankyrin repeat domain-containing protein, putative / transcript_product=Putative ankyrin repeat domain-containing protein, putative / location=Cvel_scaffold558:55192-56127(-) / protein_length=312 / sequence_SO=supercontig / SO=protein_coding / is_pseudo=false